MLGVFISVETCSAADKASFIVSVEMHFVIPHHATNSYCKISCPAGCRSDAKCRRRKGDTFGCNICRTTELAQLYKSVDGRYHERRHDFSFRILTYVIFMIESSRRYIT